ncbi:MAG: PEP-utilizing enzyme [bacterium]|nr:PEP-utilizing enzyme [bacterium]
MEKQNVIKDLGSKNWQFTYDRKMSYQRMKLFDHGYCQQLSDFFKVDINSEIFRVKNGNVSVYYELDDHKKAFSIIQERILDRESLPLIKKIHKTIVDYYHDFIKEIKNKPVDYSSYTNKALLDVYNDFCNLNKKISLPTWLLYLYFEDVLTHSLKSLLAEKLGDSKAAEEVVSTIAVPSKITPLDGYHKDLYKVVLSSKAEKALEKLSKKYESWGVYDVNYEVPHISFHRDKIKDTSVEEAGKCTAEIDKKYKEQSEALVRIKHEWRKDKYILALIDLYSFYAYFKDWKNYYREQSSYKMKILFGEIAKRLSLTPEQVSFLTEQETADALTGGEKVSSEEVNKRLTDSAFVFIQDELCIYTDSDNLNKIDECLAVRKVSSIKGVGVYPGTVTGTVKIISSTADFGKVGEGDILVSSTTRPDYLPFMKKAAGFITNEGGMLSHAAILARELKKPCIIGTKIATQVLKDGDIVSVDAGTGIVTIIK